jgi:hypothetical protein
MHDTDSWKRRLVALAISLAGTVIAAPVVAQECVVLLPLFQQGKGDEEIAAISGLPTNTVGACRRELSRPLGVSPAGAPPVGAAGAPPARAAGAPPLGAAGAPPAGAAGAPPVGRDIKRLP